MLEKKSFKRRGFVAPKKRAIHINPNPIAHCVAFNHKFIDLAGSVGSSHYGTSLALKSTKLGEIYFF